MVNYFKFLKNVNVLDFQKKIFDEYNNNDIFMIYSRGSDYYNLKNKSVSNNIEENEYFHKELKKISVAKFEIKNITNEKLYNFLIKLLDKEILKIEKPICNILSINSGEQILPHIDKGRRTAINLYINSDNTSETRFYTSNKPLMEFNVHARKDLIKQKNDTKLKMELNYNNLKLEKKFKPKKGDMFMLDVTKVHSVNNINTEKNRIIVSFNFRTNYYILSKYV